MKELVRQHSRTRGAARRIMMVLADYANDDGIAWPSIATLMAETGCSERTVQRAIRHPEIKVLSRPGTSNRYQLVVDEPQRNLFISTPQGVSPCHPRHLDGVSNCRKRGVTVTPDPDLIPNRSAEFFSQKTGNPDSSVEKPKQSDSAAQARTDALKRKPQAADVRTLCVETKANGRLRFDSHEDPVLVKKVIEESLKIFDWRRKGHGGTS